MTENITDQLSWPTAAEAQNYGFKIQRKNSKAANAESERINIGFIEGKGTITLQRELYLINIWPSF